MTINFIVSGTKVVYHTLYVYTDLLFQLFNSIISLWQEIIVWLYQTLLVLFQSTKKKKFIHKKKKKSARFIDKTYLSCEIVKYESFKSVLNKFS